MLKCESFEVKYLTKLISNSIFSGPSGKQGTYDTGEGMTQMSQTASFLRAEGHNCFISLFVSLLWDERKSPTCLLESNIL